jgi:hypothetical protein
MIFLGVFYYLSIGFIVNMRERKIDNEEVNGVVD